VLNGVDSFGNVCGQNNGDKGDTTGNYFLDLENYQHLYWTDPTDVGAPRLCVSECPFERGLSSTDMIESCSDCTASSNTSGSCGSCVTFGICASSLGGSPYTLQPELVWGSAHYGCPTYIYAARAVAARCWPAAERYVSASIPQASNVAAAYIQRIDDTQNPTALLYEFFYSTRNQILYAVLVGLLPLLVVHVVLFRHDAAVLHDFADNVRIFGVMVDPRPVLRELGITYAIMIPAVAIMWVKWVHSKLLLASGPTALPPLVQCSAVRLVQPFARRVRCVVWAQQLAPFIARQRPRGSTTSKTWGRERLMPKR
jgi:hypothetical protein